MKNSKKTIQDLNDVQVDLNKIMSFIDSLDDLDENTNVDDLDKTIDKMQKESTDTNKFIAIKEELIMTEKNKKLNIYSIIHMEKIKKKALIKFF